MEPFKIYTTDKAILEKVADKYGLGLLYTHNPDIDVGYWNSLGNDYLVSFEIGSDVDTGRCKHSLKTLNPRDFMENPSSEEKREYLTEEDLENNNFEVGKYYLDCLDGNNQLCKLDYFFKDEDEDYILIGEPVEHVGEFKQLSYATYCKPYKSREDVLQEELEDMIYRLTGINDKDILSSLSRLFIDGKFEEVINKVEVFKER